MISGPKVLEGPWVVRGLIDPPMISIEYIHLETVDRSNRPLIICSVLEPLEWGR